VVNIVSYRFVRKTFMAQSEPGLYKPSDDIRVFDGGEDGDLDDEGSRLPLLIVIALLVFFAFGGVVWLAYNQGVKHGREDVSSAVATEQKPAAAPTQYKDLEIFRPAKPVSTAGQAQRAIGLESAKEAPPHPNGAAKSAILPKQAAKSSVAAPSQPTRKAIGTAPSMTAVPIARQPAKPVPPPASVQAPRKSESKPSGGAPKPAIAVAQTKPPASPAATPKGAFVLQIGSYKSEAEASASWQAYKSSHPAAAAFASDIKRADLPGKGTWFRLRIGSFATTADALALCSKLKKSGGACFPAKR